MGSSELDHQIAQAQAGDTQALEAVLLAVAPALRRFGLHMCRHREDAEDTMQEALIAVARHLPSYDGRASLTSWAFAIARSACARHHRGDLPAAAVVPAEVALATVADEDQSPAERLGEAETGQLLRRALATLPEEQRETVLLRDIEGLTAPEVAEALGISVQAVKSRLHRAREALRGAYLAASEPSPQVESSPRMVCPDVVALWSQKLEGELTGETCRSMEAHLTACDACRTTCDALREALGACQAAGDGAVTPTIARRVRAALAAS